MLSPFFFTTKGCEKDTDEAETQHNSKRKEKTVYTTEIEDFHLFVLLFLLFIQLLPTLEKIICRLPPHTISESFLASPKFLINQ